MISITDDSIYHAAVGLALRSGTLKSAGQASVSHSHTAQTSYALMGADGHLIERFPLERLRRSARQRERVLSRLEQRHELARLPLEQRRRRFRARPARERALAWAISCGQPIPPGRFGPLELGLCVLLLLLFLLPGLVYLAWGWPRWRRHEQAMKALERKWLAAGTPDPVDAAFRRLVGA